MAGTGPRRKDRAAGAALEVGEDLGLVVDRHIDERAIVCRSSRDEGLHPSSDVGDRADQVLEEVDAMRADISERTGAGPVAIEPPAHGDVWIAVVVEQELGSRRAHVTDGAFIDQLAGHGHAGPLPVHEAHVEIALDALARGKHVLCEKPLALDGDGAHRLCQAAGPVASSPRWASCTGNGPAWRWPAS